MSEDRIDIALAEAYEGGLSAAKSRIAELEADVKDLHADIARLTNEAYTREVEAEKLRKDAERYWWLRDRHENGHHQWFVYGAKNDCLDDDIDAVREGK